MSSQPQQRCSAEEQLSNDFDAAPPLSEGSSTVEAQRADDLTREWRQLGDDMRLIPIESAAIAPLVRAEVEAIGNGQPHVKADLNQQKPAFALGRSAALLVASSAVVALAAVVMTYQPGPHSKPAGIPLAAQTTATVWEVVVVTVPDSRASLVTAGLRNAVDQRGLEIHAVNEGAAQGDETHDLLMASAESTIELLKALNDGPDAVETEWNPDRIGEFDREELLSRFAESMRTPTQSDRFFGEVFVLLPKESSIRIERLSPQIADSDSGNSVVSKGDAAVPETATIQSTESIETQVAELLDRKSDKPVLVIFRRRPVASKNLQGFARPVLFSHKRV